MSFGWFALIAFVRLFGPGIPPTPGGHCAPGHPEFGACPGNLGPLVGSTGNTLRLFFGSFALAYVKKKCKAIAN